MRFTELNEEVMPILNSLEQVYNYCMKVGVNNTTFSYLGNVFNFTPETNRTDEQVYFTSPTTKNMIFFNQSPLALRKFSHVLYMGEKGLLDVYVGNLHEAFYYCFDQELYSFDGEDKQEAIRAILVSIKNLEVDPKMAYAVVEKLHEITNWPELLVIMKSLKSRSTNKITESKIIKLNTLKEVVAAVMKNINTEFSFFYKGYRFYYRPAERTLQHYDFIYLNGWPLSSKDISQNVTTTSFYIKIFTINQNSSVVCAYETDNLDPNSVQLLEIYDPLNYLKFNLPLPGIREYTKDNIVRHLLEKIKDQNRSIDLAEILELAVAFKRVYGWPEMSIIEKSLKSQIK